MEENEEKSIKLYNSEIFLKGVNMKMINCKKHFAVVLVIIIIEILAVCINPLAFTKNGLFTKKKVEVFDTYLPGEYSILHRHPALP